MILIPLQKIANNKVLLPVILSNSSNYKVLHWKIKKCKFFASI